MFDGEGMEKSYLANEEKGFVKSCRSCGHGEMVDIISLGKHHISNFVDSEEQQGEKVPLDLILCSNCKLLQLRHDAPNEEMWGGQYWYKSAINRLIREDLKDIVDCSEKLVNLQRGDLVFDIGANDGTMLSYYDKEGVNVVGFEPSKNVAREAAQKGFTIINNYFNADDFKKNFGDKKAKLITAISMFYDLEDPNKFMKDIVECLDPKGMLVIQQNYLVGMLTQNAFDNICHEHREYYSLTSMKHLLEKYNLEVFDIKEVDINGGSFRTYIRFKDNQEITWFKGARERIRAMEQKEREIGLDSLKPYQDFASRIDTSKQQLVKFIESERARGKTFGVCGASTRGNTTLQYFDLTTDHVVAASEANPDKWGKKTVGSLIPIVSVDEMKEINPDYQIVLIWHLFDGLMGKEKDYLKNGGKFILPLPEFKIVEYSQEFDRLMVKSFY